MGFRNSFKWMFICVVTFVISKTVFAQGPQVCTFWGDATYEGRLVNSGDLIEAYDSGGQLCGSTNGIAGGHYVFNIEGDQLETPEDEGAPAGGTITFKINDKTANVSGDPNTFINLGDRNCNLDVPSGPVYPVAEAGGPYSGNEGSSIVFNGSGSQDADTYDWNFGDGTAHGSGVSPSHTYRDNGSYTVTLTVTNVNGSDTDDATASISNVAPTVEAGNNQTTNEGTAVYLAPVTFTDPALNYDVYTALINWGDGNVTSGNVSPPPSGGGNGIVSGSHIYGDNGVFTVTVTVNDGDGGIGSDNFTVTVNNVAPTAEAGGPYAGVTNQPVPLDGSATDPGSNDVPTYDWDLDNNGSYETTNQQNPTKTFSSAGTYTVRLRVTDDDGGVGTDQATVTINTGVQITVTTNPIAIGKQIYVDGQPYTTPKTFSWVPGTQHELNAPFSQWYGGNGRTLEFDSWSDGKPRVHTITVPSSSTTYTANYEEKYELTINHGGKGGNPIGGGNWPPESIVTISIDTAALNEEGNIRSIFQSWTGSGNGSYSGTQRTVQVTMHEPITQTVNWSTKYLLKIEEGKGEVSGEGWYIPGAHARISVSPSVEISNQSRHQFQSWNGTGDGYYTGTNNPAWVYVNEPIVETAIWKTQYYLDLDSTYNSSSGEDWYNENATATVEIDTVVDVGEGERYHFLQWEGVGSDAYTGDNWTFQVVMNGPVKETAQWKTQYYLDMISDWGNPEGEGWYNADTFVSFSVDSVDLVSDSVRYVFENWTGTGSGNYSGEESAHQIELKGPVQQTAHWKRQYYVFLQIEPLGGGEINPITVPGGWANAGDTLKLTAVGEVDSDYGFSHWSGDIESDDNPLKRILIQPLHLTAHFRKGKVIINTEPKGLSLLIDGKEMVSQVFNWSPGEHHVIKAISPQGDNITTKYQFREWSDGGAQEHTIEVKDSLMIYTAIFDKSYFVTVISDYGVSTGQGWYEKGEEANIKIDDGLVQESDRIRRKFTGWKGTGEGSVTSSDSVISVIVEGPITERAQWLPQIKLLVTTDPPRLPETEARIELTPAGPWFYMGDTVLLRAVVTGSGTTFIGWSNGITSTANPVSVIINGPLDILASFNTPFMPPHILAFPDTSIMEDNPFVMPFNWLKKFISDENDPFDSLQLSFNGSHFSFIVNASGQKANLIPAPNWNGWQQIICTVTDPFGMYAADTFLVHVLAVPDLPRPFRLISPPQYSILNYSNNISIEFRWKKSANVDAGDAITYSFYFSSSPDFLSLDTKKTSFLKDTTATPVLPSKGEYYWRVKASDNQGYETWCDDIFQISIETGIESEEEIPLAYHLFQNYPNPFNPETVIQYQLPKSDQVVLQIYDIRGSLVRTLVENQINAGTYKVLWDGKDQQGMPVSSGIYFVVIKTDHFIQNRKMILIR